MMTTQAPLKRLMWFIDAVLMEERKFQAWSSLHNQDFAQLEELHREYCPRHGGTPIDQQLQQSHARILQRHRELHAGHRDITRLCRELTGRIREGHVDGIDVPAELERLAAQYERMRFEHNQIQRERDQLLEEHSRFHRLRLANENDI